MFGPAPSEARYFVSYFRDESEPSTIVDEDAVMPDGWLEDEEVYIPDVSSVKPDDWSLHFFFSDCTYEGFHYIGLKYLTYLTQ